MFQTFDETGDSSRSAERVAALRARFDALEIDGFVLPRTDRHQNEYIPAHEARLEWLTGFTGSAGTAVILRDRAFLLTDGRYTLQVRDQLDLDLFEPASSVDTPLTTFLPETAPGLAIGIDPWLTTMAERARLEKAVAKAGGRLVLLSDNPLDALWTDRPAASRAQVRVQTDRLAGRPAEEKLEEMTAAIGKAGADFAVLTDPASVAWTFNIRGGDVAHTPLAIAFAILAAEGRPRLHVDAGKLTGPARDHVEALADIRPYESFAEDLAALGKGRTVGLDPQLASAAVAQIVEEAGGTVVEMADPARLPRARKNQAEIAGSREAHLRDGAAMVAFLAWLDRQEPGSLGEIAAAEALEGFRASVGEAHQRPLRDISFDTISGSGAHGAIVHYRVTRASDRKLQAGELFLVDSGAQYDDGTTDITRTVPIGTPSEEMRRMFTLVLKGMIAISVARFPKGTRGVDLDPLARIALWKAGADYAHGTGHGVGAFLAVHEGPQSISKRGMTVLEAGMILSNEPGFYKEGAYGIRIENLVLVTAPGEIAGGMQAMHGFETLTLCPIDRRLVVPSLLTAEERDWLDAYHARVAEALTPLVNDADRDWLKAATAPIDGPAS